MDHSAMEPRAADAAEVQALAELWRNAWRDAHAAIVPPDLVRLRTLETFRERIAAGLADVRVIGPIGAPIGFNMIKGDELYQIFLAREARGTGVGARLIADAEARLAANGVETAWLACAIGNERAARFYEKQGWHRAGTMVNVLDTPEGPFELEVWRYEKPLASRSRARIG
jgi:GNAT superfamily N-acetyltransferase